jgi:uncharacterized protein (TIGR02217 family)
VGRAGRSATDQVIGSPATACGEFALCKAYGDQARDIRKPVVGTVRVAINGDRAGSDAWSVDARPG